MDTVAVIGRLLVSLAAVLGLMWFLARRSGKRGPRRSGQLIDVLGRQQLGRTSSVAVVRVLDQALILGITEGQVSVLGATDLDAAQASIESAAAARTPRVKPVRAGGPAVLPPGVSATDLAVAARRGPLAGSALSPATWKQAVEAMRERTVRSR